METTSSAFHESPGKTLETNRKRKIMKYIEGERGTVKFLKETKCDAKDKITRYTWNIMFEKLRKYKETYGNCIVPRGFPLDPRLATWVSEQRKQYKLKLNGKTSSMNDKRIKLLNELGFVWNVQESAWNKHFDLLKQFKKDNGHCLVAVKHPELGLWVKEQRRHYWLEKNGKQSQMTIQRKTKLDEIGFCWDAQDAFWREKVDELIRFKAKHGHCLVPRNEPSLGTWVHHQRTQYKLAVTGSSRGKQRQTVLSLERQRELQKLGFVWSLRCCNIRKGTS